MLPSRIKSHLFHCSDWETAYKELEMQRGYCSVATRYSPALVRQQAFSSPEATLKVILCARHAKRP